MIQPLYDRILVARLQEEDVTPGGLYIPETAKEKPSRGRVIATGEGRRNAEGTLDKLVVTSGDTVLFGKFSGSEIDIDGVTHLVMREDDVLGIIRD